MYQQCPCTSSVHVPAVSMYQQCPCTSSVHVPRTSSVRITVVSMYQYCSCTSSVHVPVLFVYQQCPCTSSVHVQVTVQMILSNTHLCTSFSNLFSSIAVLCVQTQMCVLVMFSCIPTYVRTCPVYTVCVFDYFNLVIYVRILHFLICPDVLTVKASLFPS